MCFCSIFVLLHYCVCAFGVPIQVISAQQLPKLNKDKPKSIVDPLVRVEIHGVPADTASKETHYIDNNGEHNIHIHRCKCTDPYRQTYNGEM